MRGRLQRSQGKAFFESLDALREIDPYPVMLFIPGKGMQLHTRQGLLNFIGAEENSPELCRLLKLKCHPPGTVFQILFHGNQHSFLRTVLVAAGPQDN
jgi:hypothetical protein